MPGNREDNSYQLDEEQINVRLPHGFLDNDFTGPDLERFLDMFHDREPSVAVVGDAYNRSDAEQYRDVIDELREEYSEARFIVAPKCVEAFDVLDPETTTLGYVNGNSEIQGEDLGPARFRGWVQGHSDHRLVLLFWPNDEIFIVFPEIVNIRTERTVITDFF